MQIEQKIEPLVDAINNTSIVKTFSSCEGHYSDCVDVMDRCCADVRFNPSDGIKEKQIETFFDYILKKYSNLEIQWKAKLQICKQYTPLSNDENIDFIFAIKISPFDKNESDRNKRIDIDKAILEVTKIVKGYRTHI